MLQENKIPTNAHVRWSDRNDCLLQRTYAYHNLLTSENDEHIREVFFDSLSIGELYSLTTISPKIQDNVISHLLRRREFKGTMDDIIEYIIHHGNFRYET